MLDAISSFTVFDPEVKNQYSLCTIKIVNTPHRDFQAIFLYTRVDRIYAFHFYGHVILHLVYCLRSNAHNHRFIIIHTYTYNTYIQYIHT